MPKKQDDRNRFRGYTTGFRMSKEEHDELNKRVELSGLTKQDYMIKKALDKEIVVIGNKRTYKALKNRLGEFNQLLKEYIKTNTVIDEEVFEMMQFTMKILKGLSIDDD
ncbi:MULTISPECIES: hypothetical protein [unclassified Breznakia]|uniref:plasmid mobilization protein n=1 Tax=unclassified Breznakia TaxID=2623764 RepID=UPI002404BD97|nr:MULTISPECIES: hypothetical protein [unclassified Breznakia]